MRGSKTSTWVAGTVIICLLLGVAAWFLAISPRLQSASLINADAEGVEQQNEVLAARVQTLAEQFERIDEFKAELAGLRTQIPADDAMSDYLRVLDETAARHTVTLVSAIPGTAIELVPDAMTVAAGTGRPLPVEAPPTDGTAPTEGAPADGTTDAAAAPAEPAAPANPVVTIPLTVTVVGTYQGVQAFIDDLQQSTGRLLLVPGISVLAQQDGEASGGRPATVVGDVEATVTAYLYATPPDAPAPVGPEGEDAPEPTPLPVPDPGRNPLVPIG